MKPSLRLTTTDAPDTVHGRLLESMHVAQYTFARACDELKWLLRQDRWKHVGPGYDDIDTFLGTLNFSELKAARDERKDLVQQLHALRAGQRATARLLGVDKETVARDLALRSGANAPPVAADPLNRSRELSESLEIAGANAPPTTTPRPYYADDGITIYHGDCREILPTLPRGLMVTDPPYNVGYHYDEYTDGLDPVAYDALLGDVLRMPLLVIHYPEAIFPIAKHFTRTPDELVAWLYHANTPRQWRLLAWFGISPDLSLDSQAYRNPEDKRVRALIAEGRQARLYDWWIVEQVKNVSAEKTAHPCQIPVALMLRILRVTPFDGPVIDPFSGSGTTLVAAQQLGRPAIGIESSEEYCEIAALRLQQRALDLMVVE